MIAAADTSFPLPPGDSPSLVLVPATLQERTEAIKLNSVAWQGRLSTDSYLAREDHLRSQRLTKDGFTCWILVDSQQPANERTILSSCETYKKNAMLARNDQVEDVIAYGVGSVYCRPEFRGQGYAKRMLQLLSEKLDAREMGTEGDDEKSVFSVLFSDIGKRFYAQFGWLPFPSSHFALRGVTKQEFEQEAAGANLPKARTLLAEDVRRHVCNDQVVRKERDLLKKASRESPSPKIAITPDYDHLEWHWAREEFLAERLCPEMGSPVIKGAGDNQAGVYCAWNRNFGETPEENTLYILRWVYDEPTSPEQTEATVKAMAAILKRAQLEAHEWNMAKVEFWNPTPLLEKAMAILDPTAKVVHREDSSIACLRWTNAENQDTEWYFNEKYAWC